MRLATSITCSEELFAATKTTSDAFFDFATKAGELIPTLETMTAKAVVDRCVELGITYHAQKVTDNTARALQQVYPYIRSGEVRGALKLLEDVIVQLNGQTKISVLMHTASKTFTKGSAAANGALAQLMNALRIAIEYEDITKESRVTKEFLTEAKASTGPHAEESFVFIFPPRWRGPRATWGRWSQKTQHSSCFTTSTIATPFAAICLKR